MAVESIITVIAGILETGTLGFVIIHYIKGLQTKIKSLSDTVEIQVKTIEAMDKRLLETEKLSDLYKNFINDYPKAFEAYKATVIKSKDDIIIDLQEKVETQKVLIEGLNETIDSLSPEEKRSFEKITGYLIEEKYKPLQEFIQKFEAPKEKVIYDIVHFEKLEDIMRANNYEINIDDNIDFEEIVYSRNDFQKQFRCALLSLNGLKYVFTLRNQLIINSQGKMILEALINEIKQ